MNFGRIIAGAFLASIVVLAAGAVPASSAAPQTVQMAGSTTYIMVIKSHTGTVTINGKAYGPNDKLPVLKKGDAVSVSGGAISVDTGNGTISAGDGVAFSMSDAGQVAVTAGSISVTSGGQTQQVKAGQTVTMKTVNTYSSEDGTSWTLTAETTQVVVTQTSPKQETTNGGTKTTSPSTP
ncbi:MAG: hypothetical protein HY079_12170 [Elusimicrobia bacterium]|nr:hypothetical protein [Elusimicrobiota bacterium]